MLFAQRACSGVRISVLFSLFVTCAFFPSFLLLTFIRHSSAVSSSLCHAAPCLHSCLLFLDSACCIFTFHASSVTVFATLSLFCLQRFRRFVFFQPASFLSTPQRLILIGSDFFFPFLPSSLLLMIHQTAESADQISNKKALNPSPIQRREAFPIIHLKVLFE